MGQIGEMLVVASQRVLRYGEALAKDIPASQAARKPVGLVNGKQGVIDTNHPTFVYGHLSLYASRLWLLRGMDAGSLNPDPKWMDLFKAGAPCLDDPAGTIYPAWGEVITRYRSGYEAAMKELASVPDEVFFRDNPVEASRGVFPKVGMALTFIFGSHPGMHFGQVSAWRRCVGMSAAAM